MAKPFDELRERLLRAGVAPRHVRRYLVELGDHLGDLRAEEERAGLNAADAQAAALARLGGMEDLARAMTEQAQMRAWSARAPWAVFGVGAVAALAALWCVALAILWSGWWMFLPEEATPFVRVHGLGSMFFGVGRLIYFGAPVAVGWGIGVIAARQRLRAAWPAMGLVAVSLLGGASVVHARAGAGGRWHEWMSFTLRQREPYGVVHVLVILLLTGLPYLIWKLERPGAGGVGNGEGGPGRLRAYFAEAVRYWEWRRVLYNAMLAGVCAVWVAATWPHFRPAMERATLPPLAALALMANVCYSTAYLVDIPMQRSALREMWRRGRWGLWLVGTLFGILLANYWIGDEIYPFVR